MQKHTFQIDPVPASRARVSKYGTYYLPTYRKFKSSMQELVAKNRGSFKKLEGPLVVSVYCCVARPKTTERDYPRGDVDNYAKAVLDSLNGVLWDDDDQIISLLVYKEYVDADEQPHIYIEAMNEQGRNKRKVRKLCSKGSGHKRRQPVRVRRRP